MQNTKASPISEKPERRMQMEKSVAIILAAGQGKRMQSNEKKQYMTLRGKQILTYSLEVFEKSFVDQIVIVVNKGEEEYVMQNIVLPGGFTKVSAIVPGGKERYHSVAAGLEVAHMLPEGEELAFCFIHDSARPFVTEEILERALDDVRKYNACVVGMPVKDTIKIMDVDGFVESTPNRDYTWAVQTPQVFDFDLALQCYRQLLKEEKNLLDHEIKITDDAMVIENFSHTQVYLTEGSYDNIKITTPEDLYLAERILNRREEMKQN